MYSLKSSQFEYLSEPKIQDLNSKENSNDF